MLREIAARFGYVPKQELDDLGAHHAQLHDLLAEESERIMQLEGEITDLNERLERARHEWARHNKYVKQVNAVLRDLYNKHGVSQTMLELLSSQFGELTQEELNAASMPSINPEAPNFALYPVSTEQAASRSNRNGQEMGTRRVVDILKRDMHLSSKEVIEGLRIIGLRQRYGATVRSQYMLYYIPAIKVLITRGVNKKVAVEAVGVSWARISDYLTGTCVYRMDREVMNRIALWFEFNPGDFEEWCLLQHQVTLDIQSERKRAKKKAQNTGQAKLITEEGDDETTDVEEDISA